MVIRAGRTIYPREVEEFLYSHPDIEDVQVIGVPDLKYGEELCAWVKLRPGSELSADQVREYCEGKDRPLQDPAVCPVHRRVPDDRHRQVQKFKMRETSVAELGLEAAARQQTA